MSYTTFYHPGYTHNLKMTEKMNQTDPSEESKSNDLQSDAQSFLKTGIYSCARYDKNFKELLTQLGIDQLSNKQILDAYIDLY